MLMMSLDLVTGMEIAEDAKNLVRAIDFSFVVTLIIVRYILELTRPVTLKLQRKEMDHLKAESEIVSLKKVLKNIRISIDDKHHSLYEAGKSTGLICHQLLLENISK